MEIQKFAGHRFSTDNEQEMLGMSGPYVGDLLIDERLISDASISNCFIFNERDLNVYFVKYHSTTGWRNGIYFTINFYSVSQNRVYEYDRQFKSLFITQMLGDDIMEIFHAFHDQIASCRDTFNATTERYSMT